MSSYLEKLKFNLKKRKKLDEIAKMTEARNKAVVSEILDLAQDFRIMLGDPRYFRIKDVLKKLRYEYNKQLISQPIGEKSETVRATVAWFDLILNLPQEYLEAEKELIKQGEEEHDRDDAED